MIYIFDDPTTVKAGIPHVPFQPAYWCHGVTMNSFGSFGHGQNHQRQGPYLINKPAQFTSLEKLYSLVAFGKHTHRKKVHIQLIINQPSRNVDCQNMIDHDKNMFNHGF